MYAHQLRNWPDFTWDDAAILNSLAQVRYRQGRILGLLNSAGSKTRENAVLDTLTNDVIKSSEIEGELLNQDDVRSSIARRLGIELAGATLPDRYIEGVVEMMMDATQNYADMLTEERLFHWHAALFPTGKSGMQSIQVGAWRTAGAGPMQVVSGAMGKEKVHFEAPAAERLSKEIKNFINWFNAPSNTDQVLKAGVAHLWFVTIHPFDDGNGRITRTLTDMLLAKAEQSKQRFYSVSAQMMRDRAAYYHILEHSQKGGLDITAWLNWFLQCLSNALDQTEKTLDAITMRTRFWLRYHSLSLNSRQQTMLNALLDGFYGKLTTTKWAKMTKSSADTALRDIQDLIGKGVIIKEPGGGRSTTYILAAV